MVQLNNWMAHSSIQKMQIFDLKLPGTKYSGAYKLSQRYTPPLDEKCKVPIGWITHLNITKNWYITQELSIKEQLEHGIRLLDFKIAYVKTNFAKSSFALTNILGFCGYKNALLQVIEFLNNHPSEVIMINAYNDYTHNQLTQNYGDDFLKLTKKILQHRLASTTEIDHNRIKELAGKVIFLYDNKICDFDELIQTQSPVCQLSPLLGKAISANDELACRLESNKFSNTIQFITYQPKVNWQNILSNINSTIKTQIKKYNSQFTEFIDFLKNNATEEQVKKINGFLLSSPSDTMIQEIINLNGDINFE